MYYIFETDWSTLPTGEEVLTIIDYPKNTPTPIEFYLGLPLPEPFKSMRYRYSISLNMRKPYLDNWVSGPFDVLSRKLLKIFALFSVKFEAFSATLIDEINQEEIMDEYFVFNILESNNCFDVKKSSAGFKIKRLVLSRDLKNSSVMMSRDVHHKTLIIVHEDLKFAIESAGVIGCYFTPVEKFKRG